MSRRDPGNTRRLSFLLIALLTIGVAYALAAAALPKTSSPRLQLARIIRTRPFAHTHVFMRDSEGSAYVPRNRSLWLADDNGRRVYEVNPMTGALKRVIGRKRFESARRFGGGMRAGTDRTLDMESMAYDAKHDSLYVFSGSCCSPAVKPTVFRLKRNPRGNLVVESYQPLARVADYTASAWNAATRRIYVGDHADLRTYTYATNSVGRVFHVPNLTGITGMSFTADGKDLFVTTDTEKLRRVRWSTRRLVAGWTFGLTRFGIKDARAVEMIGGHFYVLDGSDARSASDPRKYAVYVFNVS